MRSHYLFCCGYANIWIVTLGIFVTLYRLTQKRHQIPCYRILGIEIGEKQMVYRIVRNKNYDSHDTTWRGDCTRFFESATLSIHISRKQISKFDIQPTPSCHLVACSLINEKNERDTSCMLDCPIFKAYKASHDC